MDTRTSMAQPAIGIAIIGCGTVGRSWAICFARAGHHIFLYDTETGQAEGARDAIARTLHELDGSPPETTLQQVHLSGSIEAALEHADYVQESIVEDAGLKADLFKWMDSVASPTTILASSTSAIMPSAFLASVTGAARCIVAHPFNPPHLIPLVEIVAHRWISPSTLDRTVALMESVGQSPIVINKEIAGFVGNRLQAAVVNEAMNLIELGVVSPADLDRCMTHGLGRRWAFMGPFTTMDLNASDGFAGYAGRFGQSYQQLGVLLGVSARWTQEAAAKVDDWRRSRVPLDKIAAAQADRDELLVRLTRWLEDNPLAETDE